MLAGCSGGGDVDMTVRKPASERTDINQARAASGALSIPSAQPFNITSFKSGQEGAARGECKSTDGNGATCRADARDGGSAWGEFQLGYCFDNVAKVPLSAAVKLRLTVAESTSISRPSGEPTASMPALQSGASANAGGNTPAANQRSAASAEAAGTPTTAKAFLKFFIKDTNGVLLKEQSLVAETLDRGPHSSHDTRDVVFDARFEPDRGYYLVIAGRAEVQSAAGQASQITLDVTPCTIEIVWQGTTAPAAASAADRKASDT